MKPGSSRGMPTRVKVALLGAVLSLGALGLPWMGSRLDALPDLIGYQDSVLWVGLRVVAALATVVLSLQLVKVPDMRETQRVVFAASGVLFLLRPITLIVTNPSSGDLSSGSMQVEQVFSPSWGIFASFLAAGLMIAATVMTHRSDDIREQAQREAARAALLEDPELAAFAGPAPAPLVVAEAPAPVPVPVAATPEPVTYAAPVPVEPPTYAAPVALGDTGPYGPDGPSRLGEGPNLVQVEDTLAPKAAAPAPHLALMQPPPATAPVGAGIPVPAPSPVQPVATPLPAARPVQPVATSGPAAPAASAPEEPRQRSVAPPGFG